MTNEGDSAQAPVMNTDESAFFLFGERLVSVSCLSKEHRSVMMAHPSWPSPIPTCQLWQSLLTPQGLGALTRWLCLSHTNASARWSASHFLYQG